MSLPARWSRARIAALVAEDIPDGSIVNLGIGMPTLVGEHLPPDREILLHSENGILGMGGAAQGDEIDLDVINASRTPVRLLPGASITDHTVSFAMMRGGKLDYAVLGGFQVSASGDLANWMTDAPNAVAAIGGAMDLAVGARQVLVMMEHTTRDGAPKILNACSYPLTGRGVVDRIYTDLAIIDVTASGLVVVAMVEGTDLAALQARTQPPLVAAPSVRMVPADARGD